MKKLAQLVVLTGLSACASVPVTGRRQLSLISSRDEKAMGKKAYAEILRKEKLSGDATQVARLREIGRRLAAAADKPDYEWEFNLIENDEVPNAFCLPGGKVAFYTGLLPIAESDAGIAVVMGHEIAHALARHGAERMSQGRLAQMGGIVLAILTGAEDPATRRIFEEAYGLGVGVGVMLPFSRKHESEADYIGLVVMAKAGYDPREALEFWRRMAKAKGGKGSAMEKYLSTHPTDQQRQENIQKWLPEALKHFKGA